MFLVYIRSTSNKIASLAGLVNQAYFKIGLDCRSTNRTCSALEVKL